MYQFLPALASMQITFYLWPEVALVIDNLGCSRYSV